MKKTIIALALILMKAGAAFAGETPTGGTTTASPAVAVSPGGGTNLSCPTFSWSEAGNASSYRIEVYEQITTKVLPQEQMRTIAAPAIAVEIAAPALSWTPSSGECLTRGLHYVWYVQGVDTLGIGQWSEGWRFHVEAAVLTVEQTEAVQQVVKELLDADGTSASGWAGMGIITPGEDVNKATGVSISGKTQGSRSTQTTYQTTTNTLFGDLSGEGIMSGGTGLYNTFIGAETGKVDSSGSSNTFVGRGAGKSVTTTANNTFIGDNAGALSTGADNTFVGKDSGVSSTASNNSFFGRDAGYSNTSGTRNTFIGWKAGRSNTTASDNTFIGHSAGSSSSSAAYNTFLGTWAGTDNVGSSNTFVGRAVGTFHQSGDSNTIVGDFSGSQGTTGSNNTFVGKDTGIANTADGNSFFGKDAGKSITSGSGNVFIGLQAGYSETTGSNKLYIDNCFTGQTPSGSGSWCIQPLIYGEFDNRIVKIDGSLTMVSVATPSDIRYKKDIHPLESSLQKVLGLRGVTYEWDKKRVNGAGYRSGKQIGLIAQEVEKVLPEVVHTDDKGYKTLSYDKLAPLLIEAVKEQHALHAKEMNEKNDRIAKLEKALEDQQKLISAIALRLEHLEAPAQTAATER